MESLVSGICQIVAAKLHEEGNLLLGVPEEAEKMLENLEGIEAVLKAAEQREVMEEDVKLWLRKLKDVAYDIEDVLDFWTIAQLQAQDALATSRRGNKSKAAEVCFSCIPSPCSCFKQAKSRHDIAHAIVAINKRLDDINEGKNKFSFPKSSNTSSSIYEGPKREDTTSFKKFITVRSQDKQKVELIEKLVRGDFKSTASTGDIPIVSVVGLGGIGKTTLARMVYHDEAVKSHFDKTIWECVSNPFVAVKVAKAIAKGLGVKDSNFPVDSTTQEVLSKVGDHLKSSPNCKFLLVLDDVWDESEGKWGDILGCIGEGHTKGSCILMTTRSSDFSQKMGAADSLAVGKLSEDDSWLLFRHYAFRTEEDRRRVEDIAKELAKKCDGLPLALEVLGRHMVTKTSPHEWNNVLNSKMWEKDFHDNVFRSLSLSYLELQSEAKRCFAFCSVFPKDTEMKKNELIRLWAAQGYLQTRGADQMEALGEECFKSLVCRSFFQVTYRYSYDTSVEMHDIVHDFAQFISNGEAAFLDTSLQLAECGGNSIKLRHLALHEIESNRPYSSLDLKALRSLFLYNCPKNFLKDFSSNYSHIRVLHIDLDDDSNDGDLEGVGQLVHLRHVRLSSFSLTVLPEEICSLPYLQTLDVKDCDELKSLPKEIGRLTCLRHLLFRDDYPMDSLPKGLGKLSSLKTLSYFPCSSVDSKDCSSLEDLGDLNNLRGHLWLKNLNQVAHVSEATAAQLHMKKQIQKLTLEFGEGDPSLQSDVLDALEPAKENYIELLQIEEYRGRRSSGWIGEYLSKLKEILLNNVSMEVLPAGLGMLCHLEILCIEGADRVKHVGVEFCGTSEPDIGFFPKLTKLEFKHMSRWEHWEGPKEVGTIMPRLRHLETERCKALRTLPRFLEHVPLESLIVDSPHLSQQLEPVEDDDCPGKWRMEDVLLPQTLKQIWTASTKLSQKEAPVRPAETVLEVVQQQHDINFTYLEIMSTQRYPGWIGELRYLKKVVLNNVGMEVLPAGLGMLCHLEILCIRGADRVKHVGVEFCGTSEPDIGFFTKLTKLEFNYMPQWEHWEGPKEVETIMPHLRHLETKWCKALRTLPRFLEHVPLESLILDSLHLPQVEPVEDSGFPGKWRMGDFLLPQTLMEIQTASTELAQKEAPGRHGETALEVEQQRQDINFTYLRFLRMQRVPGWIMVLTFLKHIKLDGIEDECLPPLGLMCSLEELEIRGAKKVEKVGNEFLGTSNTDNNNREGVWASAAFTAFPRLKQLTFERMSAWQEWEDPVYRNSNSHLLDIMPSLCGLKIDGCNRLKSLPQFFERVPLNELFVATKIDMPKIRNTITDEPTCKEVKASSSTILAQPASLEIKLCGVKNEWLCDWAKYCARLKRLTLQFCKEASFAGLEVLPSLEELKLFACDDVRRMPKEVLRISSLKKLKLTFMSYLEEWEDPPLNQLEDESRQHDISSSSIRSNLCILHLGSSPRLKALPSFLKSIPLQELDIYDCAALETWWANEAGQDWRDWTSNIPKFTFEGWDSSKFEGYTISSN